MNIHVRIEAASKATSKGQTTIPKEVRDAMGIKDGTSLTWIYEDGEVRVRARTKRLEDFTPMIPPNGRHVTVEEMNADIGAAVTERARRAKTR
jgi:AbrB family looped-hinge helix DNA binding protein